MARKRGRRASRRVYAMPKARAGRRRGRRVARAGASIL